MIEELEFDVQFRSSQQGTNVERASFGALTLRAGDVVLTEVHDILAKTTRSSIYVSVSYLARWFADHWWRLRWEPSPEAPSPEWRLAHQMGAAGGGFVWPNLRFDSDGETVTIHVNPTKEEHTIRYIVPSQALVCSAGAFERGVDQFMTQVLLRLAACGVVDDELETTWRAVLEERHDPELSTFRRHEAIMGLDAGAKDPEALVRLFHKGTWMGDDALDETLAGARGQAADTMLTKLEQLRAATSLPLTFDRVVSACQRWTKEKLGVAEPWQRGSALAQHLRNEWNLGLDPVSDDFLNDLVGQDIHSEAIETSPVKVSLGVRDDHRVRPFLRKSAYKTSRRFDIARLIADVAIAAENDRALPLTSSYTARQKFQRAAAQEFLCPVEGLRQHVTLPAPEDDELEAAAAHFQVSPFVVRNTLVNKKLVSRDYLPE